MPHLTRKNFLTTFLTAPLVVLTACVETMPISNGDTKTIKITTPNITTSKSTLIQAPGKNQHNYTVYRIDTTNFRNGGILDIEIRVLPLSLTAGSFDLFPEKTTIPTEGPPKGTLSGKYDIQKGTATRLTHRFNKGEIFQFGLEGNWFSKAGAIGMVEFTVQVLN